MSGWEYIAAICYYQCVSQKYYRDIILTAMKEKDSLTWTSILSDMKLSIHPECEC
jgi:hypothetical protein